MESLKGKFKYIFFDADDTLWENESYFRDAEHEFAMLFSDRADETAIQRLLWEKQEENIPVFSYGSKTYLIGMIDAALEICNGKLPHDTYRKIKKIITDLAYHELHILDGVEETLAALQGKYVLAVATKGDMTEQMTKFRQSGLARYFHHIEVMENKDENNYLEMASKFDLAPENILMVGNSVKSDIAPVINIGGTAIHTPHKVVWTHEMMEMPESDRIFIVKKINDIVQMML